MDLGLTWTSVCYHKNVSQRISSHELQKKVKIDQWPRSCKWNETNKGKTFYKHVVFESFNRTPLNQHCLVHSVYALEGNIDSLNLSEEMCLASKQQCPCKFFLAGVNFYRFNAKIWQFSVYFVVIYAFFRCKYYSPKILPV